MALLWPWLVCAALCAGCSLLVEPQAQEIRCAIEGEGDPCVEVGMQCISGVCQPRECTAEICDGLDNDCDDKVDEGQDVDEDGFTWCGTDLRRGLGLSQQFVDCQPRDATIHPPQALRRRSAPEVVNGNDPCDGKDNDCDGSIDEGSDCEPMQDCTEESCAAVGLLCDEALGRCVAPQPEGTTCSTNAECAGGFCADAQALGLDNLSTRTCGSACCTDADCANGSVCVHSENGARVCLPAEFGGRQSLSAGERCSLSPECASGVCSLGTCRASCTNSDECGGEDICALNSAASGLIGGSAWICGAVQGRGAAGELCISLDPTSCRSGLCTDGLCSAPCADDSDCPVSLVCRYVVVEGLLTPGQQSRLTACVRPENGGSSPCCTNADCEGGICAPKVGEDGWGMFCSRAPQ